MTIRLQVQFFEQESGVGADLFVNTWYCQAQGATDVETAAQSFADDVSEFYQNFAVLLTDDIIDPLGSWRAYDLTEPEPRSPIAEGVVDVSLLVSHTQALPTELAVCMSYRGAFVSGTNKGQMRGRVYLGGFQTASLDPLGRVDPATTIGIRDAGAALLAASDSSGDYVWCQHSAKTGICHQVIGGWVDNAWDIQRRRGLDVTDRTEFGAGRT